MKTLLLLLFPLLMLSSCYKETVVGQDSVLTISDFEQNLSSDMDYLSLVETFGEPQKDIGSGIHIYVYRLKDDSEVWIGYTDRILYAQHLNENHEIIKVLL